MNITRLEQVLSELSDFVNQQCKVWGSYTVRSELFHYTPPRGLLAL